MALDLKLAGRIVNGVFELSRAGLNMLLGCPCCGFCCEEVGPPDDCGNREQECVPCPNGPKPNCVEPCPARPPCVLQCVEIGVTACEDPVYDCVYSTEIIGIPVETCEECPEPPPCEDQYYCCFEFQPSLDPNSPWPPQACRLGPCESIELYSSGPHLTLNACNAACKNYYCCYEYAPSENPEMPLPPSFCQVGPCADPTLQAGGPYPTLAQCSCRCCKKVICRERVWGTYQREYTGVGPAFCFPPWGPGCPVNDGAPGTIAVSDGDSPFQCGRVLGEQTSYGDWAVRCDPPINEDVEIGDIVTMPKYYDRLRAVDDCADCMDTAADICDSGVELLGCFTWDGAGYPTSVACGCAGAESFCDNPLP